MARAPYNPVPEAAPTQGGTPYESLSPSPASFGALTGQAEQHFGAAESQVGGELANTALRIQDFNNTQAARQANNAFMVDLTGKYSKFSTLEGQAAHDALPDFQQQVEDTIQQTAATLQSPAARSDFLNSARFMSSRILMGAGTYAAQQQKKSWIATNAATATNAGQFGIVNQNDPSLLQLGENNVISATRDNAGHLGLSPDETAAETARAIGRYYHPIIESQAARDPTLAMTTFSRVRDRMDAVTQAEIDRSLRANADRASVGQGAAAVIGGVSAPAVAQGAGVNSAWQRLKTQEAGEDAAGNARVSPAGATSISQMMPDTAQETAQKHGVAYHPELLAPGPNYDSSYSEMLGRLHFGDLVEKYQGNVTLASAAYNAGEGRVDGWLKTIGDPRKGVVSDAEFAAQIPIGETRKYVQAVAQPSAAPHAAGVTLAATPGPQGEAAVARPGTSSQGPSGATPPAASPQHVPEAFGAEQQMVQSAWREAQTRFPNRPDLQRQMVSLVYDHIQQTNVLQAKYEAEQAKAQRDAQEAAGQTVIKQLMTDPTKFDPAVIRDNAALTYTQKESLWRLAESHLAQGGDHDAKTYGPGFWSAYQQVHAAPPPARSPAFTISGAGEEARPAGMLAQGNIDLNNRRVTRNDDGSISTEQSIMVTDDAGQRILLPTIINGRREIPKAAIEHYKKTGEHLGVFDTDQNAESYANALHERQGEYYLTLHPDNRITDPSQLWRRGGPNGDLTVAGIEKLTQEIQAKRTPDGEAEGQMKKSFFDAAHVAISLHGFGVNGKDPIGEQKFAQFQVAALTAYDNARRQGITPQQLLSEKSPDYIGNLIPQFVRTNSEKMRDFFAANNPDAPGASAAKPPAELDLTTKAGIAAAYRSGHYGMGPEAYDAAAADLAKIGAVKAAPPPAPTTGAQVPTK